MERATDRKFCEMSRAILSTTGVDRHGDRLHETTLKQVKSQIENDPEKRILRLNHEKDKSYGEIVNIWIEKEDDGLHYLYADIGIYQGHEEIVEKVESGELGGMSLGFYTYVNSNKSDWESRTPNLNITVDGHERKSLNNILKEFDEEYRIEIQKSIDAAAVFEFVADNWGFIEDVALLSIYWFVNERTGGFEISPKISLINQETTIELDALSKKVVNEAESEKLDIDDIELVRRVLREEIEGLDEDETDSINEEEIREKIEETED